MDDELIPLFAAAVEADAANEWLENGGLTILEFDTDEIAFQWPLPSHGLQKRLTSTDVNEWVVFAPGYPAWEMVA